MKKKKNFKKDKSIKHLPIPEDFIFPNDLDKIKPTNIQIAEQFDYSKMKKHSLLTFLLFLSISSFAQLRDDTKTTTFGFKVQYANNSKSIEFGLLPNEFPIIFTAGIKQQNLFDSLEYVNPVNHHFELKAKGYSLLPSFTLGLLILPFQTHQNVPRWYIYVNTTIKNISPGTCITLPLGDKINLGVFSEYFKKFVFGGQLQIVF